MKKYYPEYYRSFSCIADKCPDSCCSKWEIVIDKETLEKYNNCKALIGEKIRSHIMTDEEGDCCFSLADGRCPFLNERGLCDIHIDLGEDFTSEICRNHPRFIEEYDGFTEISLSLSCPEANRIILSSACNESCYPVPEYHGEDEVLQLLIESRRDILSEKNDIFSLLVCLLDRAADNALDIDLVYIEDHPDIDADFIRDFAAFLLSDTEILTAEWKSWLEAVVTSAVSLGELREYMTVEGECLVRICHYFIYRYYLKAVNDLDIYSRALFIASVCYLSAFISKVSKGSLAETARLLSKEIEHNTYNLEQMLNYFSRF